MNILVTSAGRRVKIIEYFKNAVEKSDGKIIATDCDINAPALYFADAYEIVPRIDEPNYIQILLDLCEKHHVQAIISLIDPELELLAKHKSIFDKRNIQLILSPYKFVEISFDKYKTFEYLTNKGIPTVPTYNKLDEVIKLLNKGELVYPLVVKPARGSASLGLYIVENEAELREAFYKFPNQIIQPFYKDREFGIDVYIDMISGELVDLFIKEKIRMRAGETDKSISVHNKEIENLIRKFINQTEFIGPIDIDCFEYGGKYFISEINPRFGGGYPHAYELGCDYMSYIVNNLHNQENSCYKTFSYEANKTMLKYDRILIK